MKINKKVGALAGLAALAAVGGTWAFFNQTAAITNPFTTKQYNTSVVEHFNPADGEDWKPGGTVDKTVSAKNTGDYPILVRVSMDEKWYRDNEKEAFKTIKSSDGDVFFNVVKEDGGGYKASQFDPEDGLAPQKFFNEDGDDTVVYKNLNTGLGAGKWFYDNGYWYWNGVLAAGTSTEQLMDSVTLASNIDLGKYVSTKSYYVMSAVEAGNANALDGDNKIKADFDVEKYLADNNKKWITAASDDEELQAAKDAAKDGSYFFRKAESGLDENAKGYAGANYDLTITTEFIQATKDAVWTNAPEAIKNLAE